MVLTRRGWGLLVAAATCWVFARLLGVSELSMATAALVVAVVLAVVLTRISSSSLRLDRRVHPARLHHGEHGEVTIDVGNLGRLPSASLRIDDGADPGVAPSCRFALRPLSGSEAVALRYPLVGRRRGRYAIGPATVEARDPLGLARRTRVIGGHDEVVVYPRIEALEGGPRLGGHEGSGTDAPPRPGAIGEDASNVREYVRGDDLRTVHWRTTAHRGKLMVRQAENRQRPEAVLLLDRYRRGYTRVGGHDGFEVAVSAVASIVVHLERVGIQTVLVDGPLTHAPMPVPLARHLDHLADVRQDSRDAAILWEQLARGTVGEGSLVAVVPPPDARHLRSIVRGGRGFGTRVALIVVSDPTEAGVEDAEVAARSLRAAGWRATVVRPGVPLSVPWGELGRRRRSATAIGASSVGTGPA